VFRGPAMVAGFGKYRGRFPSWGRPFQLMAKVPVTALMLSAASRAFAVALICVGLIALTTAGEARATSRSGTMPGPRIVIAGPSEGFRAPLTDLVARWVRYGIDACMARHGPTSGDALDGTRCPKLERLNIGCGRAGIAEIDGNGLAMVLAPPPALVIGPPCDRVAVGLAERFSESATPFAFFGIRPDVLALLPDWRGAGEDGPGFRGAAFAYAGAQCADRDRIVVVSDQSQRSLGRAADVRNAVRQGRKAGRRTQHTLVQIQSGPQDFTKLAARILRSRPTRVIALAGGAEGAGLVRALRTQGYQGTIVGPQDWISDVEATAFQAVKGSGRLLAIVTTLSMGVLEGVAGSEAEWRMRIRALLAAVASVPSAPAGSGTALVARSGWYDALVAEWDGGRWLAGRAYGQSPAGGWCQDANAPKAGR